MVREVIGFITAIITLAVVLIILGGFLTTWAWNVVIPQVFQLPQIDVIQGIALNVLGWTIIKSVSSNNSK